MRWVILLLFAVPAVGGYFFDKEVDYFGEVSGEKKKEAEERKEDYYERIWKETQNWFPPNVSPVERELYKNPYDPVLRNLYIKYIEQRTQRARVIGRVLEEHFKTKESVLTLLKDKGVRMYYFYSPSCPYCLMSEDTVRSLSDFVTIHRLNVDVPNPRIQELIQLWNIRTTPTLVAFSRKGEMLGVWEGAFTWDNLNFHRWLESVASRVREEE